MKTKITRLLLSAVLMMCCAVSALAQLGTPPIDEIWYTTTDGNMCRISSPNDFGTTIKSHKYENGLGVIAFDEAVTSIGDHAFWSSTSLQSISIPSGVTSIKAHAFDYCTSLQSISIPSDSKLTSIGEYAFNRCTLQSISIPSGVTSIGAEAFDYCTSLQSISIPSDSKLTSIGEYAFWTCTSLQSINIPSGVTSIGRRAFGYCKSLQSISIPSGVTSIEECTFVNCASLQSITFHSIPNVEEDVFVEENVFNLLNIKNKTLDLNDSNKPYIGTSLENYPSGGFTEANYHLTLAKDSWETVVLPFVPSSESISNLKFYSYEGVDDGKVFVSEATDIQAGVPYLVKNVSEDETTSFTLTATNPTITLTTGSRNADGFTFKGCFRSSDIAANSNLYYLDGTAFQKATQDNLAPLHAYIEAPKTCEEESMDVVIWNPGTVPEFVDGVIPTATTTGRYGYWLDKSQNKKYWNKLCTKPITDDSKLTVPVALNNEIWYTSTDNNLIDNKVNSKTNEYQYGLGKIVLADGVTEIADNAFNRNKTLKSIFIPSSVKKVGNSSFWECINLNSIFISEGVTVIDQYAFGKTPIQSILIPSTVQTIATGVFNECTQLQSIVFHSLPKVEYGFQNCNISTKVLDLKDGERPYIGTSLNNYPSGGFTEANYHFTLAKDSWGTVVLPFVPSSESISNLEFYSYEGVDDGKVFVSKATDIQAGVPYLVKNVSEDETTSFTLTATNPTITLTAGSTSADGFTFKGCFRSLDIAANSNLYYLDGTAFQKATQDNVAPLHAYIVAPEIFEKKSMDVVIWNPETAPVFVDGVIPTSATTGRYGYWLDKSQKKFWTKFCARPIIDDSELTVPVALNNEIWYTTTDNNLIENKVKSKTNEYQYGLGKIVLTDGVTEIAKDAFNRNKTIQSIFIPSAVKKVGNSSFWGCTALESVIFSSLPDVDQYAFGECNKLATKVLDLKDSNKPYIGTSLNNYPSGGFTEANYHLTLAKDSWGTVVLPFVPSSKSISNLEFYSYEGVDDGKVFVSEATNIQAGVPYLVKNVSKDETTSFTLTATNPTITLTAGSRNADGFTFKGCFRSSDIAANSNLYYLDGTAFQKATQDNVAPLHAYIEAPEIFEKKSMDVVIWNPETAPVFVDGVIPTATTTGRYGYWLDESQNKFWTKFCARPITDDNDLTVQVAKDNEIWYTSTDNNLIENKVNSKTNEYQYGLGKIVLADGVTEIADNAFNSNITLKSIFIPSAVKKIGNSSFLGCDAMEYVIFSSLPDVDNNAFGECDKLTTKVLDLKDGERPYIGTSLNNYPNGGFTEVRYRRTFEKNTWETVVLPFVPTQESITGLEFYVYNTVSNGIALVSKTTDIQAGTPYIVKNISDKTEFTFTAATPLDIVLNTSDRSANGFTMKGTFQSQKLNNTDSKKFYCQNSIKFKVVSGEQRIDPFRVYLETENISAAESLIISDSEHFLAQDDNVMLLNSQNDSYYLDNVDLKYGHSYFCTDDFKATNSSYKLRVNPGKWNSLFVPFAVTTGTLEANNLTAAYIAGVRQYEKDAEGNITTQVDIIKIKNARLRAGTPYLVKYDGEDLGDGDVLTLDLGETDFAASSDVHPLNSATTTASYDFIGCYEKAEFDISDKDMYYFIGSNGSLVHSKSNSFSALDWYLKVTPKGDVYDDLSTLSLAKSIIINVIGEEDETTGIRTLYPVEKQVQEVYDLSGRRLNASKKGQINIINGKKILVK